MRRPRARHTTVPPAPPVHPYRPLSPPRPRAPRTERRPQPPQRRVAHIVDDSQASLLDVVDNLLNKGVVINADLILALANVDLVFVRLAALLCAADRLMPTPDAE